MKSEHVRGHSDGMHDEVMKLHRSRLATGEGQEALTLSSGSGCGHHGWQPDACPAIFEDEATIHDVYRPRHGIPGMPVLVT